MAYQETTTTGYGTRLKNSLGGIGTGLLLFVAGTALLWWNEGRAVKTDKMLNEAEGVTVEMEDVSKIDPEFEGKLVHATAFANTTDSLSDPNFNVGATAIGIQRKVEYFQWVEHASSQSKDKFGGKEETVTTYTYSKEWTSRPQSSETFHDPAYQNKNYSLFQSENFDKSAENVRFGAYKLNSYQIGAISNTQPLDLNIDQKQLETWNKECERIFVRNTGQRAIGDIVSERVKQAVSNATKTTTTTNDSLKKDSVQQDTIVAAPNKKDLDYVHMNGNVLYFGESPSSPQVGDVRITFTKTMPANVSIIAKVAGETFTQFKAKNGKTFQALSMGNKTAAEMYESGHASNNMWLWILRILGVLMICGGLKGIFGILITVLKVIPFVANIVGWGVNLVCNVVGIAWSLIIIAIAWIFYRPLLAIALLAIAGFLIWVFAFKGKDKLKEMAHRNKASQI
ncbi:MAG: TMEM43 family protein [Prevotella sp.]|nr:TMEM43 family protein [Prevotella sp.]